VTISDGTPLVAFHMFGAGDDDLRLATRTAEGWTVEPVGAGARGYEPSIAIALGGDPHVAYRDVDRGCLAVASRVRGRWRTDLLECGNGAGQDSAIVFDAAGEEHVVYSGRDSDLRHARKSRGRWRLETVDPNTALSTALAFDGTGRAQIVYYGSRPGLVSGFAHAMREADAWQLDFVEEGFAELPESLAIDSQGGLHTVLWDDVLRMAVRYAHRPAPDGVDQDCDGEDG